MAAATLEAMGLVHHEHVERHRGRLRREGGIGHEVLDRDHHPRVGLEGVEALAQLARHVGAARGVEQHEDLVELPPQLGEPLDGEGAREPPPARAPPVRCAAGAPGSRQASTVLPRPTSSASSQRTGSLATARSATWSWCGKIWMRPPRNEPRPPACRSSLEDEGVQSVHEVSRPGPRRARRAAPAAPARGARRARGGARPPRGRRRGGSALASSLARSPSPARRQARASRGRPGRG